MRTIATFLLGLYMFMHACSKGVMACTLLELRPEYDGISAACCESTASPDCSLGFPAICTRGCAALVTPFWADCKEIVMAFGDIFPSNETLFQQFAEGTCQQATLLYEHASVSECAGPDLNFKVDEVNNACCEQDGEFMCTDGGVDTCTALIN